MIRLVHRSVPHTRFWVYFGLLEESASQNFKERKTYMYKNKGNYNEGMDYDCKAENYKSFYKYPIDEVVLKGYTEELVKNETMGDYRSHTAVDFKGEPGCKVTAINDGVVLDVYTDDMYGLTVEIDHGGKLIAKYSGFDNVNVSKGSPILIGEEIGILGKVPFESKDESHLHFETKLEEKYVNPLDVMGKTE